ncbi:MAG: Holliday junction resolvase RuvX [Alphaproteobacteria bacterium]|nr:Holliday junction resolvase RuvX [Alphaproteobacteria bacterium]
MLIRNISDLPALLEKGQTLLGLDYGSKAIGVAVSDPALSIASPLATITRKKFPADAQKLAALMEERNAGALVLGLPRNMDGSEGATAQAARAFARNFEKYLKPRDLPVAFWDERLSSAAVERFMIEDNMSRKRRDEVIDKAAAAYILQGALDALRHMRG